MPMWRGFEAWLVSEGDRLPEYLVTVHDEPGETPIVQCWVPCTVGEKFTVFWKDHNSGIETVAYIMLDCYTVPGRFLHGSGTAWRSGARITDKTERPFVFRDANEVEDFDTIEWSSDEEGVETMNSLGGSCKRSTLGQGTVSVKIKLIERTGPAAPNKFQQFPPVPRDPLPYGNFYAGFGPEHLAYKQHTATWHVKALGAKDNRKPSTHIKFVFRYRTRDFLQSQGIVSEAEMKRYLKTKKRQEKGKEPVPLQSYAPKHPVQYAEGADPGQGVLFVDKPMQRPIAKGSNDESVQVEKDDGPIQYTKGTGPGQGILFIDDPEKWERWDLFGTGGSYLLGPGLLTQVKKPNPRPPKREPSSAMLKSKDLPACDNDVAGSLPAPSKGKAAPKEASSGGEALLPLETPAQTTLDTPTDATLQTPADSTLGTPAYPLETQFPVTHPFEYVASNAVTGKTPGVYIPPAKPMKKAKKSPQKSPQRASKGK